MRLYTIILISICSALQAFCQHSRCGTTLQDQYTTVDFVMNHGSQQTFSSSSILNEVPIQVHIIGSNTGLFAVDSQAVVDEIAILNSYFVDIGIEFVMCHDFNYINDNQLVRFIKDQSEWICDQEDVPNAINIYFAPQLERIDGVSICGYAPNFDLRPRVFIDNNCVSNGVTLTHEFGHSFSLVHTHRTAFGEELVNGSNCETAGDFLCDTPADPTLSNSNVNANCEYTGTALDDQQNPYQPDVGNVMSYAPSRCINNFSDQQLMQMSAFYAKEGAILNCMNASNSIETKTYSSIRVYPNPSDKHLYIENVPKNATVQLWNLNGQLLTSFQKNTNSDRIEVQAYRRFGDGIYYLNIISLDTYFTEKIIKTSIK